MYDECSFSVQIVKSKCTHLLLKRGKQLQCYHIIIVSDITTTFYITFPRLYRKVSPLATSGVLDLQHCVNESMYVQYICIYMYFRRYVCFVQI